MDIVLRAALIFLALFLITRVMGRRELGQMEPFDVILLVVIGDLIQQGVTQGDYSVTGALLAVATIVLCTVFVSWSAYRFPLLRPVLEGEPLVLISDGEIVQRNLRRERISVGELAEQARLQQIPSLDEVRWAVLETGGRISFIPDDRDAD